MARPSSSASCRPETNAIVPGSGRSRSASLTRRREFRARASDPSNVGVGELKIRVLRFPDATLVDQMQLKSSFSLMTSVPLVTLKVPLHLFAPATLAVPFSVDAIAFPSVSIPAHEPLTVP